MLSFVLHVVHVHSLKAVVLLTVESLTLTEASASDMRVQLF